MIGLVDVNPDDVSVDVELVVDGIFVVVKGSVDVYPVVVSVNVD